MDFPLKENIRITTGADFLYYFTNSQKYKCINGGEAYNTKDFRPFGAGINFQIGFHKQFGNIYLNPQLVIPVYQVVNGDPVFNEDEDMRISKWFDGIGVALCLGKSLK